jgi:hypothetical protein
VWNDNTSSLPVQGLFHPFYPGCVILWVNFDPNAVPSPQTGGRARCSGSHEGIKYGIPHETEHSDQPFC